MSSPRMEPRHSKDANIQKPKKNLRTRGRVSPGVGHEFYILFGMMGKIWLTLSAQNGENSSRWRQEKHIVNSLQDQSKSLLRTKCDTNPSMMPESGKCRTMSSYSHLLKRRNKTTSSRHIICSTMLLSISVRRSILDARTKRPKGF